MNFCQKEFDLDKTRSFYDLLKTENPIFLRATRVADHKVDMFRVVT